MIATGSGKQTNKEKNTPKSQLVLIWLVSKQQGVVVKPIAVQT